MDAAPAVAICICTCRRPEGLGRALGHIAKLTYPGPVCVIVVENHAGGEGNAVCDGLAGRYPHPLHCLVEPRPGISFARNTAMRAALSEPVDFVAMIDDDEWPEPDWLEHMLAVQAASGAAIVCGPVEPVFETPPPDWIVKAGHFQSSGESYGTSNVLFSVAPLRQWSGDWFEPRFALIGGEDKELIDGLIARGHRFAAAGAGAAIHEWVPPERATLRYIMARGVRDGNRDMFLRPQRDPGLRGVFARAGVFVMKIGYALNHLFWSALYPWRLSKMMRDFAAIEGMVMGMRGYRYEFYAVAQQKKRYWARSSRAEWCARGMRRGE